MADNQKNAYEIRLELVKEALSIVKDQWFTKRESIERSAQDGKYMYKDLGDIPIDDALKIANKLYDEFVQKR